jgi:putative transferase (TIGR04331 family)
MPALKVLSGAPLSTCGTNIVVVFGSVPRYFYAAYSVTFAGQFIQSVNSITRMLMSLPTDTRKLVRLCPMPDVWASDPLFRARLNSLKGSVGSINGSYLEELKTAKLVIITYNGTSLLEALHHNKPTIIIWHKEHFRIRKEAKPVFLILEKAGILFTSHKRAVDKIQKISKNPEEWWRQPDVQYARQVFCDNYVWSPKGGAGNPLKLVVDEILAI